jgi:hypothetical protein
MSFLGSISRIITIWKDEVSIKRSRLRMGGIDAFEEPPANTEERVCIAPR